MVMMSKRKKPRILMQAIKPLPFFYSLCQFQPHNITHTKQKCSHVAQDVSLIDATALRQQLCHYVYFNQG